MSFLMLCWQLEVPLLCLVWVMSGIFWSRSAWACLFNAYCDAGGSTAAGSSAILGRGIPAHSWKTSLEAELLGVGVLAGCIG